MKKNRIQIGWKIKKFAHFIKLPFLTPFKLKWLPTARIYWHILFVLIKTNTFKKIVKIRLKVAILDVGPFFDPVYLWNGNSYVKSVDILPKGILIRNQTKEKKPHQTWTNNEHYMPKCMKKIPISATEDHFYCLR